MRFATSGQHTLRVQVREDGVSVDQVVLSPATFLTVAPGALTNDSTRLMCTATPSALPTPAPSAVSAPTPATGATTVAPTTALSWTAASNATAYDVALGTTNRPAGRVDGADGDDLSAGADGGDDVFLESRCEGRGRHDAGCGVELHDGAVAEAGAECGEYADACDGRDDGGANDCAELDRGQQRHRLRRRVGDDQSAAGRVDGADGDDLSAGADGGDDIFWKVDAKGAGGTTPGAVWSFTTAPPPTPAPSAVSAPTPATGATTVGTTTALSWTAASNATAYDVALGRRIRRRSSRRRRR